jgi:hypothetical protein
LLRELFNVESDRDKGSGATRYIQVPFDSQITCSSHNGKLDFQHYDCSAT